MKMWVFFLVVLLVTGCARTESPAPSATPTPAPSQPEASGPSFKTSDEAVEAVIALMNSGRFAEGVAVSDLGLREYPTSFQLLANKATCLLQLQQFQEGYETFGKAAELAPADAKWTLLTQQARCAKEMGLRGRSEQLYGEAEKQLARDSAPLSIYVEQLYRLRAENLAQDLRHKESIPYYTKAMEVPGSDATKALIGRALAFSATGNEASFKADLAALEKISPDLAETVREEAAAARDLSPEERALQEGVQLLRAGRYEEALVRLDEAIEAYPNSADAYRFKGSALQNLKRFPAAVEAYSRSYSIDENEASLYNRATCYIGLGDLDKAKSDLDTFLEISQSPEEKEKARKILELLDQ